LVAGVYGIWWVDLLGLVCANRVTARVTPTRGFDLGWVFGCTLRGMDFLAGKVLVGWRQHCLSATSSYAGFCCWGGWVGRAGWLVPTGFVVPKPYERLRLGVAGVLICLGWLTLTG
jgi:hypothetical protein